MVKLTDKVQGIETGTDSANELTFPNPDIIHLYYCLL